MKKIMTIAALAVLPAAMAVAQPAPGGGQGGGFQRLLEADANHDGSITKDEYKAYRTQQFDRLDANKDGALSGSEIPTPPNGGGNGPSMLERMDANKDGKIDKNEFVNGPSTFFDRIDTNHDGTLSKAELDAARSQAQQQRPQ
jgi:Ca2+-binding EF-hand superfamily protein